MLGLWTSVGNWTCRPSVALISLCSRPEQVPVFSHTRRGDRGQRGHNTQHGRSCQEPWNLILSQSQALGVIQGAELHLICDKKSQPHSSAPPITLAHGGISAFCKSLCCPQVEAALRFRRQQKWDVTKVIGYGHWCYSGSWLLLYTKAFAFVFYPFSVWCFWRFI